jgi:hypothetical protein
MVVTQAITADTLKECADQFFDHVEVNDSHVYIYFPELTVTNEYDLSIDIKGLVVRFNYLIKRDNTVLVNIWYENRVQSYTVSGKVFSLTSS